MTEAEKKMKKYTRAVNRKLNLPSDVKKRVMTDFTSSIQSRKEAGKTDEEIYAELGSPADVAADLNEQMKELIRRSSSSFASMVLPTNLASWKMSLSSNIWRISFSKKFIISSYGISQKSFARIQCAAGMSFSLPLPGCL